MALRFGTEPHSMTEKFRTRLVGRFFNHADCILGIDCMVREALFEVESQNANHDTASTFQSGLVNGGPAVLIYGLTLSWLGSLAVCASLAEMASMQAKRILSSQSTKTDRSRAPTSGGQYHWVAQLAPARFAVTFSWAAGAIPSLRPAESCAKVIRLGLNFRTFICLCQCGFRSSSDDPRPNNPKPRKLRANTMAWNNALLDGSPDCRSGQYSWHQGVSAYRDCRLFLPYLFLLRPSSPFGLPFPSKHRQVRFCRF